MLGKHTEECNGSLEILGEGGRDELSIIIHSLVPEFVGRA